MDRVINHSCWHSSLSWHLSLLYALIHTQESSKNPKCNTRCFDEPVSRSYRRRSIGQLGHILLVFVGEPSILILKIVKFYDHL